MLVLFFSCCLLVVFCFAVLNILFRVCLTLVVFLCLFYLFFSVDSEHTQLNFRRRWLKGCDCLCGCVFVVLLLLCGVFMYAVDISSSRCVCVAVFLRFYCLVCLFWVVV